MATREHHGKDINETAALEDFLEEYNASNPDEQISLGTARREWVRFRNTFPEYVARSLSEKSLATSPRV